MTTFTHFDGRFFTADDFDAFAENNLTLGTWRPQFIVLHNTGTPNISQRPHGYTDQTIANLRDFYTNTNHWHGGPHLIVDQNGIWILNDLRYKGVHSPSWNALSWGVEMLGDFDHDDPKSGTGAVIVEHSVRALAALYSAAGIDSHTLKFHREDPLTTHYCPGHKFVAGDKEALIGRIHNRIVELHAGGH